MARTGQSQHSRQGRSSVSCGKESVSPSQDALPWIGQERGSVVLAVWLGKSDAGAPMVAQLAGASCVLKVGNGRKSFQKPPKNPEKPGLAGSFIQERVEPYSKSE